MHVRTKAQRDIYSVSYFQRNDHMSLSEPPIHLCFAISRLKSRFLDFRISMYKTCQPSIATGLINSLDMSDHRLLPFPIRQILNSFSRRNGLPIRSYDFDTIVTLGYTNTNGLATPFLKFYHLRRTYKDGALQSIETLPSFVWKIGFTANQMFAPKWENDAQGQPVQIFTVNIVPINEKCTNDMVSWGSKARGADIYAQLQGEVILKKERQTSIPSWSFDSLQTLSNQIFLREVQAIQHRRQQQYGQIGNHVYTLSKEDHDALWHNWSNKMVATIQRDYMLSTTQKRSRFVSKL